MSPKCFLTLVMRSDLSLSPADPTTALMEGVTTEVGLGCEHFQQKSSGIQMEGREGPAMLCIPLAAYLSKVSTTETSSSYESTISFIAVVKSTAAGGKRSRFDFIARVGKH